MKTKIEQLRSWIAESKRMVFFGGAGVSTESGIPDFRSVDGLYHQKFDYPPETIISHSFFLNNPEYFYRFYREKMLPLGFEPNVTHRVLARLEQEGHLAAVVTQNIDGLHQAAGSKNVLELHGSVHRNICQRCGHVYSAEWIMAREHEDERGVPICPECGGPIKPDVVLYGEGLDNQVVSDAILAIREADMLIVGGTSLVVYPAAGLIDYFLGQELVVVNRDPIPVSSRASVIVQADIAKAFDF